jgi:SnoaL-like domain
MTTFENTAYTHTADAYIAAWNTRDAAERERAVAAAFAPGATYTDPLADVSGRDAITELIGGAQQQFAGWTFRLAGPVDGHHGQARFTWALGPDDSNGAGDAPVVGFDVVTLDDAGLITSVLGFLDRVPSAA